MLKNFPTNPKIRTKIRPKTQPTNKLLHANLLLQPKETLTARKADLLNLSSPEPLRYNYQHQKKPFTSTTTTQQPPNYNPNQKQTLESNEKKWLCTQDKPTTTKTKKTQKQVSKPKTSRPVVVATVCCTIVATSEPQELLN